MRILMEPGVRGEIILHPDGEFTEEGLNYHPPGMGTIGSEAVQQGTVAALALKSAITLRKPAMIA